MAKRLYKLGSLATDSSVGLKSLITTFTTNTYSTFEQPLGTDYQVPAGKKFIITRIRGKGNAAGVVLKLFYGDNGVQDSIPPPTNSVQISEGFTLTITLRDYTYDIYYEVPSLKYPCIRGLVAAGYCEIQGLEI